VKLLNIVYKIKFDQSVINAFPNLTSVKTSFSAPLKPNQLSAWSKLNNAHFAADNQKSFNQLSLNGLNNLVQLTFENRSISSINNTFSNLGLENLYLRNNLLTSFDVYVPESLIALDLSQKQI